ncbi:MAG: hypothetical protein ABFD69_07225 [Candidatus Sumerlaeia bacterium]
MFSGHFSSLSWIVIVGYMLFTTWLGKRLAGRQATIRDFFLGGRKLPWYAICGSIIATELSAVTLVGAPAFLWAETGNMTYAILGVGTILARIIVGFVFVPRYYDEEIYSPYEYIGNRLGERARRTTSALFMVGGMMGQGARLLMSAVVLNVIISQTGDSDFGIHYSIWIIGAVAILWTYMGGIKTVIWTDVIQFVIFSLSAALTLVVVVGQFQTATGESGIGTILKLASDAGKLEWLDLSLDPRKEFTLLTGLVASTLAGLAAYGTDQMMVQRMFCCRGPREARRAIIWSSVSQVLMLVCLLVGVGLWAFYQKSGMAGVPLPEEIAKIDQDENSLLPVFIKYRVHWFFGGIMVAGIFAAAISTLESILAALAQQSIETLHRLGGRFKLVHGDEQSETNAIRVSRIFVVFWGVVLCAMASLFYEMRDARQLLIVLALSVVGYTAGGILGTFLMALIPGLRRRAEGMEWAALLSVMTIFALRWHEPWAPWAIAAAGAALIVSSVFLLPRKISPPITIVACVAVIMFLNLCKVVYPDSPEPQFLTLAFPWFAPLGAVVMITASQFICMPASPTATSRQ